MLVSPTTASPQELEHIARRGPIGAVALCSIAVGLVAVIWVVFYLFTFLPRGLLR